MEVAKQKNMQLPWHYTTDKRCDKGKKNVSTQ